MASVNTTWRCKLCGHTVDDLALKIKLPCPGCGEVTSWLAMMPEVQLKPEDEIEHKWTDFPVCPWCGEIDQDWWDGTSMRNDGDEEQVDCGWCGRPYKQTMSVDVKFDTERAQEESNVQG